MNICASDYSTRKVLLKGKLNSINQLNGESLMINWSKILKEKQKCAFWQTIEAWMRGFKVHTKMTKTDDDIETHKHTPGICFRGFSSFLISFYCTNTHTTLRWQTSNLELFIRESWKYAKGTNFATLAIFICRKLSFIFQ